LSGLEDIIHQPLRLKIMAALWAQRDGEPLDFVQLKRLTGATDGNLGSHLATLEKAGLIAADKGFVGKKPRTQVCLTKAGAQAFRRHVNYLRDIVESSGI
jgi:DNA-binding MarR family transcriptional regulator